MAIVPEAPSLLVHAQGTAIVAVSPTASAGDLGSTITVAVTLSNVDNLVGYDVALTYDPTILSAVGSNMNSAPDVFAGMSPFVVTGSCSNGIGVCESAQVLLGGSSVMVSTAQLFSVNFKVLQAAPTDLSITKNDIAALVSGSVVSVPVTVSNGNFLVPPTLTFVLPNATVAPGQRTQKLSNGATQVTLQGFITYDSTNVRAGFGGVLFDIIDPNGGDTPVSSNIAFFFPGQSATVTATYTFATAGNAIGTYHIIATMLRCPDPSSCVNGQTTNGLFFKLKA
jgi:Cohesin domain